MRDWIEAAAFISRHSCKNGSVKRGGKVERNVTEAISLAAMLMVVVILVESGLLQGIFR